MGKFLAIQAFAKPHYLSIGFTEDSRIAKESQWEDLDVKNILDLEKLDPLRRAFKLAEYAENSTSELGQTVNLKSGYLCVKEELETFSRGVLTSCHNMAEVKVILEHRPEKKGTKMKPKQPNFMKALWEGRADFVSHPYFQEYFHKRMMGNGGKGSRATDVETRKSGVKSRKKSWDSSLPQLLYMPYALLLFFCYPLVVFTDFFRDADILFVEEKKEENRFFAFFRSKIHTPFLRQNVHVAIQAGFAVLIVLMMWNPIEEGENDHDKLEHRLISYMVLMATVFFFVEEGIDFLITQRQKDKGYFFEAFWNLFSLGSRFLLLIGLATFLIAEKFFYYEVPNRAVKGGDHILNVSFTLVSLGVAAEFFKILRFFLLFQTLGPMVICVINCVQDAVKTIAIYAVIFCTFGIFAWGMFKPFHQAFNNHNSTVARDTLNKTYNFETADAALSRDGLFHRLLWKMYSAGDQTGMQIKYSDGRASHTFSHSFILMGWVGGSHNVIPSDLSLKLSFQAFYQLVVAIIMINLLIAVMNNTFSEVWQTADKKWKYSRSYYQVLSQISKNITPSSLSSGSLPAKEIDVPATLPVNLLHRALCPLVQDKNCRRESCGGCGVQAQVPDAVEEIDHNQAAKGVREH